VYNKKECTLNNLTVTKSNKLIEASYQLNTNAQKLLLCCIAQLDSRVDAITNKEMTITTLEYERLTGVSNPRRELYKSVDALFRSSVIVKSNESEEVEVYWIQKKTKKHKGDGAITVVWSEDVLQYLTQLQSRFTSYKLANISELNTAHAIRLYELLMRFKSTGERVIFVDDFKSALGISGKYSTYKELNRRVIQPSLRELKKSNLDIEFIPMKKGRKIEALAFTFKEKSQREMDI
jgi:plasmid replication initiation protein